MPVLAILGIAVAGAYFYLKGATDVEDAAPLGDIDGAGYTAVGGAPPATLSAPDRGVLAANLVQGATPTAAVKIASGLQRIPPVTVAKALPSIHPTISASFGGHQ
jgi:hypothetical protein